MNNEEAKKTIELIKQSYNEIGKTNFENLSKEVDNDLKEKLGEEKFKVWEAANGTQEEEQNLIDQIGETRYSQLLDEIITELSKDIKVKED